MNFKSLFAFIFSLSLPSMVFAESAYHGTGAAGTAGAVTVTPSDQDPGTVGNGVGGMGTGTSGDHSNGTRSDTHTHTKRSLPKGNPGNPSSQKTSTEGGMNDKP